MPAFQRVFFFSNFLNHAFSYKVKKSLSILTQTCQQLGLSREESKIKLQEKYDLSPEEAESIVARYWEQDS